MILWIIFAGLTTAAMVAVLWPFLRPARTEIQAGSYDTAVFKDQLQEIAAEEQRGLISKEEAEAARTEVSRRLLASADLKAKKNTDSASGDKAIQAPALALIGAFLCVPVLSSGLYLVYGSPGLPDQPLHARLKAPADTQKIDALVAQVEARLREHPGDGRGWDVIAPVYMRQRRFTDAANAYDKALRLLGETPERLLSYGNAAILANDGVVSAEARRAIEKAVAKDDKLLRGHFWLAMAEEQDGNFKQAAKSWRDLLEKSKPDAPWREVVRERLQVAERKAGIVTADSRKPSDSTEPATDLKGPSHEQVEAARDMSTGDRAAMIEQMVAGLAERLKSEGGSLDEWSRLVRSYTVLGKRDEAAKALANARSALANNPAALESLNKLGRALGL